MIDAHVHCYPGVAPATFLAGAARNFAAGAAASGIRPATAWLLLTETAADEAFAGLAATRRLDGWTIAPTAEPIALVARSAEPDDCPLVLVAGRQIVTAEGLEVLAIAAPGPFGDGGALTATVAAVRAAGGIPILPWGFGKWWGRRGAVLDAFLATATTGTIFLGDNGGRPALAAAPPVFAHAAARGIWVLPGSDPLPLPAEAASTAGRYGFLLDGTVDLERPATWLKRRLSALTEQPRAFGRRQALLPFVQRQVAMQWRKRCAA